MRLKRYFLVLALGALGVTSCGSSKNQTTARGGSNAQMAEKSIESPSTPNRSGQLTVRSKKEGASASESSDVNSLGSLQAMYSDVGLEKEQIVRFEREWKNAMNSWKKLNPNETMNSYERIEQQDQILKDILKDDQYKKYQKWTIEHAGG